MTTNGLRAVALLAALAMGCKTAPASSTSGGQAASPATPGVDPAVLDRAVSPCEDFYRFACGTWIWRTPPSRPTSRSTAAASPCIDDRNLVLLRAIAEADAAGKHDPQDRYPDKVGDFWAACMDEAGVEAHGLADLRAAWGRIDAVKDPASLAEALG